jgi:hypothetical protein
MSVQHESNVSGTNSESNPWSDWQRAPAAGKLRGAVKRFETPMPTAQENYAAWAQAAMYRICERMVEAGVVGRDAHADVAWTVPSRFLIARVTTSSKPHEVFWATGGELPVDFIPVKVAATVRDAARHFCLRWQLEGARIAHLSSNAAPGTAGEWKQVGGSLADKAELLNEFERRDEFWGAGNIPPNKGVRQAG